MVVIGSDHAGFSLKEKIRALLSEISIAYKDVGTLTEDVSVDYPLYANQVVDLILENSKRRGILICGTGVGMSIAANRHKGVRAALCHDVTSTNLARTHNDANILVLGSRIIGVEVALDCVKTFLDTSFDGGRHKRRIEMLD